MSETEIKRIIGEIQNKNGHRFIVKNELMCFLHKGILNCVRIHKENGVYHFSYDNRSIRIDCTTGNCIIVDFQNNCFEFFCVGSFLKEATNKHFFFLYQLLIRAKINRIDRKNVISLRLFIKPDELLGQIEISGKSCLKPYSDCLSIREMFQGINEFIFNLVSGNFIRSRCLSSKMTSSLMTKRVVNFSESGIYGIKLLLRGENNNPLPPFAMICEIMRKFLGNEKGVRIVNGLITNSNRVCYAVVSRNIIETIQSDLNKATNEMNELIMSSSSRATKLSSKCSPALNSFSKCVFEMLNMSQKRNLEKQEARMKKLSSLAFQEGINEIDKSMRCVQQGISVLEKDEIASGECEMMRNLGEDRNYWDEFVEEDKFEEDKFEEEEFEEEEFEEEESEESEEEFDEESEESEEDEETNSFGKRQTRRFK